jgi:serine/threonine protein kinase
VDRKDQAQTFEDFSRDDPNMTAPIVLTPGNTGPVNDGERRVLERFATALPSALELHPNLQVAVGGGQLVECDLVVFGPDCMWIVEVKDLAGEVIVGEHEFVVNGEARAHPVHSTRIKAQKIKSRLSVNPELTSVWIQQLVVLARVPRALRIAPTMTGFVTSTERAIEVITNPTAIGLQRDRLPDRIRSLAKSRLALDSKARTPRSRFGAYVTDELLSSGGGHQWWRAHHEVFDTHVMLQVVPMDATLDQERADRHREDVLRAAKVGRLLGAHPNLLAPDTAFIADDGSIVVVHPVSPLPTLDSVDVGALDDETRRTTVAGVARLLGHCARLGVAHRTLGPSAIHVAPNGSAKVTGFTHAGVQRTKGATVAPADWAALGEFWESPEHAGGQVGPPADLYALGKLIDYLWPDGAHDDLAAVATSLAAPHPGDRRPTAQEVSTMALRPSLPPPQKTAGSTVGDRYVLDRQLGKGAHATVWAATDTNTNQRVALKLYDAPDAGDQILREYETLLDVSHEAIVRVRDATRVGDQWALVTELLDGPDLRSVMLDRGSVAVEEAVPIALRLLDGLRAVHPDMDSISRLVAQPELNDTDADRLVRLRHKGFAHRDVKPENVILVDDRGPVLVDFGLSARHGEAAAGGTLAYRPPDVTPDGSDPDTDLFAVGVLLHELVTGEHPYRDRDPVEGDFCLADDIDPGIGAVISRACAPARTDRFSSAGEFIGVLAALGIEEQPLQPPGQEIVARLRSIENAIAERRWDDAIGQCSADWTTVRERIERRRALDEGAQAVEPILEVHGFSLTPVGIRSFSTAKDTGGNEVGPGVIQTYLVRGPAGETLEVLQFRCDDGTTWVQGGDTFQTDLPLKRLGQGLRLSTAVNDDRMMIELRVARVDDQQWSNLFKADRAELDAAAGVDIADVLGRFGATEVGTRADVAADDSRRKGFMCVAGDPTAEHLPVVAHFLTRVLPLGRADEDSGAS